MQVTVQHRPSYAMATALLEPNEEIQVEAGSMVAMSQGIRLDTSATGGLLSALKRSILGGESFFLNTYRAPDSGGELMIAPALPGDLVVLELDGDSLLVQSGAFVASSRGIAVDVKFGGASTFFASEGLFLLRCGGKGRLVLSSYGAIEERAIGAGETFTVDTGHLVAFPEGISFRVRAVGGIKSTLFSGEGLVVDLRGPASVWMQTRSTDAFLTWLVPQVQRRTSSREH